MGEVIPAESLLYSVEIAHADRQPIRFSKAFREPTMCELSKLGRNQPSVYLTKAAVLRHIAAAQPWSTSHATLQHQPQNVIPPTLVSTVEHAMQTDNMAAFIQFYHQGQCGEIGSTMINGRKLYYAAHSDQVCALNGPLHFDWTAQFPIIKLDIMMITHGHSAFRRNDPACNRKACSSCEMQRLQAAADESVCKFFWDQYPVSDDITNLKDMQ